MAKTTTEQPLDHIKDMASDIGVLIRNEVEMARTEMLEKAKSAGVGAGMLSASAITALLTVICLTALAASLLALVLPLWAAILILTVVWGGATAILALRGKRKLAEATPLVPEQTIAQAREDFETIREEA